MGGRVSRHGFRAAAAYDGDIIIIRFVAMGCFCGGGFVVILYLRLHYWCFVGWGGSVGIGYGYWIGGRISNNGCQLVVYLI